MSNNTLIDQKEKKNFWFSLGLCIAFSCHVFLVSLNLEQCLSVCLSWPWCFWRVHCPNTLLIYSYLGLNAFFSFFSRSRIWPSTLVKAFLTTGRKSSLFHPLPSLANFLKMFLLGHKCHDFLKIFTYKSIEKQKLKVFVPFSYLPPCSHHHKGHFMHMHLFLSSLIPYLQNIFSPLKEGTWSLYTWRPHRAWPRNGRCLLVESFKGKIMVDMIICLSVESSI